MVLDVVRIPRPPLPHPGPKPGVKVDARSERWREHRKKVRSEIVDAAFRAIDRLGPDLSVREVAEEVAIGVEQADLVTAGGVLFRFPAKPEWDLHVAVFRTELFQGEPAESDELVPAWYPVEDLPWDGMWPDARHWLPRVLSGETIQAEITLGEDGETVTRAMFHVEHDA